MNINNYEDIEASEKPSRLLMTDEEYKDALRGINPWFID